MQAKSGGKDRFARSRVACWTVVCGVGMWFGMHGFAIAAEPASGTSDESAQKDARQQLPVDKLTADARRKVDAVLSSVTLFRRLPVQVIRCDPDLYQFMTTRPDVTVNIWQVLDLSNIRLTRTGEATFRADDAAGTQSDVQFLHVSPDTLLVYAVGTYQGPLFVSPIRGGALLLLKTGYIRERDGQCYVTTRLDAFFRVDSVAADLLTRTLQPLVNDTADKNFQQAAQFMHNLSRAAERDPDYMDRLSRKLTSVSDADRKRFAELTLQAAERAAEVRVRKASHMSEVGDEPTSGPASAPSDDGAAVQPARPVRTDRQVRRQR